METQTDVVVVSAFGRGHWLAAELKSTGFSVTLIDVSDQLGRWSPEDIEGPFGVFQSQKLTSSQKARLDEEDYSELVDDGFVVWLKSGPIDTRGPHAAHLLKQAGVDSDALDYVGDLEMPAKRKSDLLKKWSAGAFANSWFVNLAHSLSSSQASSNKDALAYGEPLNVTAPYSVRRVSRRGFEKSLKWLEAMGVNVYAKVKIHDFASESSQFFNIELEGVEKGLLRAEQFVWCLSSSETKKFSDKFFTVLYPNGDLPADWVWMRYRIGLSSSAVTAALPLKFLVIEDLGLRWSHANLIWMQKTASPEVFDAWVRIPDVHRFQKAYLENLSAEILDVLRARLPGVEVKVTELPQEHTYDAAVLGPATFQIYSPEKFKRFKPRSFSNLFFDGPETWPTLDWNGQFEAQNQIFAQLKTWKLARDLAAAKKRQAEEAAAARQQRGPNP